MQAMADHTIPTGATRSGARWTLISLRPQGNVALRRAVAGLGGHVLALPPGACSACMARLWCASCNAR